MRFFVGLSHGMLYGRCINLNRKVKPRLLLILYKQVGLLNSLNSKCSYAHCLWLLLLKFPSEKSLTIVSYRFGLFYVWHHQNETIWRIQIQGLDSFTAETMQQEFLRPGFRILFLLRESRSSDSRPGFIFWLECTETSIAGLSEKNLAAP